MRLATPRSTPKEREREREREGEREGEREREREGGEGERRTTPLSAGDSGYAVCLAGVCGRTVRAVVQEARDGGGLYRKGGSGGWRVGG